MKNTICIILILVALSWFIPIIPTFNNENTIRCIKAPCPSNGGFQLKTLKEIIN